MSSICMSSIWFVLCFLGPFPFASSGSTPNARSSSNILSAVWKSRRALASSLSLMSNPRILNARLLTFQMKDPNVTHWLTFERMQKSVPRAYLQLDLSSVSGPLFLSPFLFKFSLLLLLHQLFFSMSATMFPFFLSFFCPLSCKFFVLLFP